MSSHRLLLSVKTPNERMHLTRAYRRLLTVAFLAYVGGFVAR